jgi:choice-of-anchor A domain-containing protein
MWCPQAAVSLVKTAGTALDGQTYTITGPGSVTYTYAVKNIGNTWLKNLAVTDDKLGFIGIVNGLLGPGEEMNLTATVTVSADVTNVGTVYGTPVTPQDDPLPGLDDVSATDDATVHVQPLGSLGDRVWVDANRNGVQDAGEPGLIGVTVTLLSAGGDPLASTVTASDGSYLLENVAAGTYRVRFSLPTTEWHFVSPEQGSDDERDSDANPATGVTPPITLADGQQDLSWDAGVYGGLPPGFCDKMTIGENYNALIFGDFAATGGDTEGRLAVGGTAWITSGYSVGIAVYGEALPPLINLADMLIVRGDLHDGPWQVNGNVVYGGTRTGIDRQENPARRVGPPVQFTLDNNGNVPDDGSGHTFETLQQQVELASAMIASMDDRGVLTNEVDKTDFIMTFVGNDAVLNVFNVDASDWSGSQMDILITAPKFSTVVFNIHGTPVGLHNGAIRLTGVTNDRILFNYADATELSTSGFTHEGAVLAPHASGNFSGGAFEGFGVFGGDVTTSNGFEFHHYPFRGTICTQAEASPALLLEATAGDAADGTWLTVLGGSAVTITYRVTNTGNTALDQVQITDALLGTIGSLSQRLGPGESATLTALLPNVTADTVLHATATGRPVRNDGTWWNGYANASDTDDAAIRIGSPSSGGGNPSDAWQRADFAVTGIEFITRPTVTGEVFSVQVTVDNHGELAADAGRLTLYLASPEAVTVGAQGVASKSVGVLQPGESKTLLFQNLIAGTAPGTQHLRAYVDSVNRVTEWSEGDNQLSAVYALNAISLAIASTQYGVELSWNSAWGQKYTLYRCTDLSEGFLLYKSHVEAAPPTNTFIDADVIGTRFYRLVVEQD